MSKPMHHLNIGNESYEVVDSTARNATDVLTGQVDQLVVENTTNASGWKVVTTQQTVEKDTDNTACTFSDLPEDFVLLEASYSDTTIAGFRETDGLRTNVWHTTAGDGVTFTVPSANVATTNVIFYLTYAYPDSVDLSELTDIRVGADGVTYATAGEAVRSQILKTGMSEQVKQALLACFEKVAWANDKNGKSYVDALEDALYPPTNLVSISAVYTQSGTVYDNDSLNDLKTDLVVTAYFNDATSEVVTGYSLSGTLTEGTSIITVSYNGKTDTFNVTVTAHELTLDDVAYGSLTYRDIFITNNIVPLGDFEDELNLSTSIQNYKGDTNKRYKINAGTPEQSTSECVSSTHSLKCFGSTSTQIQYLDYNSTSGTYLAFASVNVSRYSAGKIGINVYFTQGVVAIDMFKNAVTDGWEHMVASGTTSGASPTLSVYIGSMSSANLDGYIDDVVITPLPEGLSEANALILYNKYLQIRRSAA